MAEVMKLVPGKTEPLPRLERPVVGVPVTKTDTVIASSKIYVKKKKAPCPVVDPDAASVRRHNCGSALPPMAVPRMSVNDNHAPKIPFFSNFS